MFLDVLNLLRNRGSPSKSFSNLSKAVQSTACFTRLKNSEIPADLPWVSQELVKTSPSPPPLLPSASIISFEVHWSYLPFGLSASIGLLPTAWPSPSYLSFFKSILCWFPVALRVKAQVLALTLKPCMDAVFQPCWPRSSSLNKPGSLLHGSLCPLFLWSTVLFPHGCTAHSPVSRALVRCPVVSKKHDYCI